MRDPDDLPPVIFAERYEQGAEEAPAAPVPPTTSIRCDVLRRIAYINFGKFIQSLIINLCCLLALSLSNLFFTKFDH